MRILGVLALIGALVTTGCEAPEGAQAQGRSQIEAAIPPFPMQSCVNLGNALEAEVEGSWGYTIRQEDLAIIQAAGFDGVRLPVRWDPHASQIPPYRIDQRFMDRVAQVVDQAMGEGLMVQLDVHHYEPLISRPNDPRESAKFVAIWDQIAQRFSGYDGRLMFELLNEPYGEQWTNARLMELHAAALSVIRRTNPNRMVILGGIQWNTLGGLEGYTPPDDPYVAMTYHHYGPYEFTHQNAEWLGAQAPRWNRVWGTRADVAELERDAAQAAAYARRHGIAMQLGEFGVINTVPLAQRQQWLATMRTANERLGIGWCVWDFGVAFNIYDRERRQWVPGAREALGLR
jgi:endoglucanase